MSRRAARTAGRKPPTNPITTAKISALTITPGESAKPKPISEKLVKLTTEIRSKDRSAASPTPRAPPTSASTIDSTRKAASTLRRLNPTARNVPTSTVRLATAAYMDTIAPHLGVEGRASRVGDPDHGPAVPPERELRPECSAFELAPDALSHDHLVGPELERPPLDDVDAGSELQGVGRDAADRHVPERVAPLLVEVDDEDHFPRRERATVGGGRHPGFGLQHLRRPPVDLARELRGRRAPQHDDVVEPARLDEGRFQAAREHEHAREDEHDQRQAADGERRGETAGPEAPPDVRERDSHHGGYPTVLRPTTIGVRTTRWAGKAAAATPASSAAPRPSAMVVGATLMTGKKVGSAFANPRTTGNIRARPSTPPANATTSASPTMKATRWRPEKPSVFKTAYSRVRSRTAITIVFASTRRMIPTITTEITCSDVMMAEDIWTKLCWNSRSLSVFVGARELPNCSSIAVATRGIASGDATRRTYQPASTGRPGARRRTCP